jgi:FMN reductase
MSDILMKEPVTMSPQPGSPMPGERQRRPFIVGLGGTNRPGSSTEKALKVSLHATAELGAETLLLGADDLQLPMYTPDLASRTPAAHRLVAVLRRCDGLIIGSPGYHGSLSGLVKNALDYTEDMRDDTLSYLEGRAVGCIACAAGWQATGTTLAALRSIVHALRGWPTPMAASVNTALPVFAGDGSCIEPATRFQLETLGRQVVEFARMRRLLVAQN